MIPDSEAQRRARSASRRRSDRLMEILAQKLRPASIAEAMEEARLDAEWRDLAHDTAGEAARAAWRAGKGL